MTEGRHFENGVPAVSVIVPVCNVEDYLEQCLEGLRKQTLENMEFILVDDGSKDSCPQILSREAQKDPRMRVITKPNGGYGSGINRGLSEARGEYIGIVEPDDWIDPHMYEALLDAAFLPDGKMADIVKSSYWEYYDFPGEKPFLKRPNLMKAMPKQTFSANIREDSEILNHHPSIWSAVYRSAFLEEKGIRMIEAPGGGWVDNPFLYEVFLQAGQYVWLPAAFYYYRQTNPNSSSNMKNVRLPFERLRDIRAVYKRLEISDPQLRARMYARHFFYTGSTIGEWGYSEKDPQVRALIHEAVSSVDPQVVYGDYKGMRPEYRTLYESVAGDPAGGIPEHTAAVCLKISVVVPVCDDRYLLADTLKELSLQSLQEMEIICADGASSDASYEIACAFAKKDKRFRILQAGDGGFSSALRAGFEAASAPLLALVLPGQRLQDHYLADVCAAMAGGADLCISLRERARTYCSWETDTVVSVQGNEAPLLLNAEENFSGCVFRMSFLKAAGIRIRGEDTDGTLLILEAVCRAKRAAVRFGEMSMRVRAPHRPAKEYAMTDLERYRTEADVLDAAHALSETLGPGAERAFRSLAVRRMRYAIGEYLYTSDGRKIFEELQDAYCRYSLREAGPMSCCNIDALLLLQQRLTGSYETVLRDLSAYREERALRVAEHEELQKEPAYQHSVLYRAARKVYRGMRRAGKSSRTASS